MKKIEITCGGCGKVISVTTGEGHTGIAKCDCGATTYVKGDLGDIMEQVTRIMEKLPAILGELKQSKRKGFETGLDEALHQVAKDVSIELLQEDPELRAAIKEQVRAALESAFLGPEELGR